MKKIFDEFIATPRLGTALKDTLGALELDYEDQPVDIRREFSTCATELLRILAILVGEICQNPSDLVPKSSMIYLALELGMPDVAAQWLRLEKQEAELFGESLEEGYLQNLRALFEAQKSKYICTRFLEEIEGID